jgi:hypothetical protein
LQAIASNNANEEAGKFQERGMALITYGDLIQLFDSKRSGWNNLGLGCWTYMRFIGDDKIITRVICRYSPCINKEKDLGTVYQQHCRHLINKLKDNICPQKRFQEDLLCHIKQWRKEGKHLIFCINVNRNIYLGELGWQLTDLDGLGMKEVVDDFTGKQLVATYFQGSKPIDGI